MGGSKIGCFGIVVALFSITPADAFSQGFGDLLKSISSIQIPGQPESNQSPAPAATSAGGTSQSKQNSPASLTERYCRNLYSVASMEESGPVNETLISDEFKIEPKDFYDEVLASNGAKTGYSGYAIPSMGFYRGEFETNKVNVIFDLLLSYPSPKYAAALIALSRRNSNQPRYDSQERADAVVALAILHYRMQDKSRVPARWKELLDSVKGEEHYLSKVLWSRLYASDEIGASDITKSITLAREANALNFQYRQKDSRKTWSPRNYQTRSNQTLYEVLVKNPTNPQVAYYKTFVQRYAQSASSTIVLPEVQERLAPGLSAIEKSSKAAATSANMILSGATEAGNIKAQQVSLDSALRTRVSDATDYNADAQTLAALSRQLAKIDKLDENQNRLLAEALKHAHDSGDRSIAMMGPMLGVIMDVMMRRGIEAMPGVIPYAQKLQSYSDSACSVVSRLDHAAMVKKAAAVEPERAGLANLMAEK